METKRTFLSHPFLRFSIHAFPLYRTLLVLVFTLAFLPSCVEKRMSLMEAKQVTVSMEGRSFVPPPRRIDDILTLLEQPGQFDPEITAKIKAKAEASPPDTNSPVTLANFYSDRGQMALALGRYKQALEDQRIALSHAEKEEGKRVAWLDDKDYARVLSGLSGAEAYCAISIGRSP